MMFEEIFENPRECRRHVAESVGLPLPEDSEERLRLFQETHLEADLRHHRTGREA